MRYVHRAIFLLFFLFQGLAFAASVPGSMTYQGRIIQPNTLPLEAASVTFLLEIRSPVSGNDCLLYSETHTGVNMVGSGGNFSLAVGTGTRTDGGTYTFADVFDNNFDFPALLSCAVSNDYVPGVNDVRKFRVTFNDNAGSGNVVLTPDQDIQSVPFAIAAERVGGKKASDLLQVNTMSPNVLDQANLENVFSTTNHTELLALLAGTSTLYHKSSQGFNMSSEQTIGFGQFSNVQEAALTAGLNTTTDVGKTWVNSDTGKVMYWDGTSAVDLSAGGGGAVTSVFGRTGVVVATAGDYTAAEVTNVAAGGIASTDVQAAINELDTEKLSLSGGTMSGVIAMGSQKITGMADATNAQDAATLANVNAAIATNNGSYVAKAGDSMTGALAMGTNKITGLGDPTANQDAATKNYTDGRLLGNTLAAPGGGQVGQSIRWNAGGTAWEYYTPGSGGLSDIVNDTTPQLGGTLDINGQNMSTATGFNIDITGSSSGNDFTVDTDKLVVEGDTGNVGVGTATPDASALLDVSSTTKGFLPPRMTTTQRDAVASPAEGLTVFNTTTDKLNVYAGGAWTEAGSTSVPSSADLLAIIVDQKTDGTHGGSSNPAGSWNTRDLNTELYDPNGMVTISSNQFTLAAGTYEIDIRVPGYRVDEFQARLQNVTDGTTALTGEPALSQDASATANIYSVIFGVLTIPASKTFEVQMNSEVVEGESGTGFGRAGNVNTGVVELYTAVKIRKIGATTLANISQISDIDANTKIQLEESADENIIRFDTAGIERMTINATGDVDVVGQLTAGTLVGDASGVTNIGASAIADNSITLADLDFASTNGINIPQLSSAPGGASAGQMYYNTSDNKLYVHNGTSFVEMGSGGGSSGDANLFTDTGQTWNAQTTSGIASVTVDTTTLTKGKITVKVDGVTEDEVFPGQQKFAVYNASSSIVIDSGVQGYDLDGARFVRNFSLAGEEASVQGLAFNNDGTKMFVSGSTGDDINEYTLGTAFNVSTAVFVDSFSVATEDTDPEDFAFNSDGTKMFVLGNQGNDINMYNLSTAFDVSTAVHVTDFLGFADPKSIEFSQDGLKMFVLDRVTASTNDNVRQYSLSAPFELTGANHEITLTVGTYDQEPDGLAFSSDGLHMFVGGQSGDEINQFKLSAPFDLNGALHVGIKDIDAEETTVTELFTSPDGQKLFVLGQQGDDVNEYDISGTGRFIGSLSIVDNISVNGQETASKELQFSNDGTKMFVIGETGDDVNEYTLSTAFDASTASFVDSFSISGQESQPRGLAFSADGTKMFVCGTSGDDVNEYTLGTAFDVSTASFVDAFSVSAQESSPQAIAFSNDGLKMFVLGATGNDVNEYTLGTAFDVSTASFVDTFSVSNQDGSPTGLKFTADGLNMFIVGNDSDSLFEYSLTSAFDISTASFSGKSFYIGGHETSVDGITLNSAQTKLYIIGDSADRVHEFDIVSEEEFSGTALASIGGAGAGSSGGQTLLIDGDSDTHVKVEASSDEDRIRMTTAGSERMTILETGNVGIGITSPSHILHINGQGRATNSAWATTSDIRLKDIDGKYKHGLKEILRINTVRFHYKKDNPLSLPSDREHQGIIAQELQEIIPEAIEETDDGYLTVNVDPVHWATVNAVQELHGLCEMSQEQQKSIESRVSSLEERDSMQDREIASLKSENSAIKAENQEIKAENRKLSEQQQLLEKRLEVLEELLKK